MPEMITYEARPEDAGQRLDVVLSRALGVSRTRIADLARSGQIRLDRGKAVKPSLVLRAGDKLDLERPEDAPHGAVADPERIPLNIVYEDRHLLVIDKPAGMVVHPAPGHRSGTLVNALLGHLNHEMDSRFDMLRPGIVHRLDKDTSGLLAVALTFEAHESLSEQIRSREMSRIYHSLTWGHWPEREGSISAPLARSRTNRKRMSVQQNGGRESTTHFRVLETYGVAELVEARLETGRTHQIRVHFSHSGHPVLGDPEYGGRAVALRGFAGERRNLMRMLLESIQRQALHAHRLSFRHPANNERLEFVSPIPEDMLHTLQILRNDGDPEGIS